MFAVITLETSLKVKVIPVEWIRGFDFIGSINDGINASETHVVFYCDNLNQRPNFGLPIFSVVREEYEGCYWARINKFFGTYNIFPSLHEMYKGANALGIVVSIRQYCRQVVYTV